MRPPFRSALGAALVVLVVGAALAGESGRASAESDESPDPGTITTVLQPGWNMVGWLGPEAPATDLFEAIPALVRASAWDAAEQRYQRRTRTSVARYGLRDLEPGMGLWLELGGDAPFEWTRPAPEGGVLLSLRAGRNLVGWGGSDGLPIEDALERFGASLVTASRWDAEARGYDRYQPGADGSANTFAELGQGDGLWVELTTDARWWQSGTVGIEFTFPDSVPAERQAAIREDMASVVTFFAERYGIEPPEFTVIVDLRLDIFAGARAREILISKSALDYSLLGATLAHEYFHVLQRRLGGYVSAPDPSPRWMTEGAATYAGGLYQQERWSKSAEELRLDRLRDSLTVTKQLDDLERSRLFYRGAGPAYSLAALAVQWLSGYAVADAEEEFAPEAPGWASAWADEASYLSYYQRLGSVSEWEGAFKRIFGLSVDDFYESFEEYRSTLTASRFPHLGDDEDEPVLVFVGEAGTETETAVRAALEDVQAFFGERFGAGPADYTVYAAVDAESVAEAYVRAFGGDPYEGFCSRASGGAVALAVIDLSCRASAPHYLDRYHYDHVRDRLAPWSSLPEAEDGLGRRGPWWLRLATKSYTEHAYEATAGSVTFEDIRDRQVALAKRVTPSLASLELWDDADGVGYWEARALTFLAGEWLAEHAGEPTLFEYYRQLPSSANWQEAFEASFGITADAFYEDFEAHRAEVAPPLPHLTDDSDEPVLVILGEIPPEKEAAVRTTFAGIQELFGERLAAGSADYTAYVGADAESLADVHLLTTGNEVPEGFCSTAGTGIYIIATVDCVESSPRVPATSPLA